ncbi:MAG: hypothetical protein ACFB10_07355 [Salibacteraceae bacterium]
MLAHQEAGSEGSGLLFCLGQLQEDLGLSGGEKGMACANKTDFLHLWPYQSANR